MTFNLYLLYFWLTISPTIYANCDNTTAPKIKTINNIEKIEKTKNLLKIKNEYHDIIGHDAAESGFQNKTALKYKVLANAFEEQVKQIRKYLDSKKISQEKIIFA